MKLGIDVSTYLEELEHGARYFKDGIEIDPLDVFRDNGVEWVRIRLWNNPFSNEGKPYLAGNCDINHFIKLSKLVMSKGYKILLDFHYSDFWADPGKQFPPKAWKGYDICAMESAVYEYTYHSISMALNEGINIGMVQIGNEITNGFLWPLGKLENEDGTRGNYNNFTTLLKAGIRATRELLPNCKIILHLERSNDRAVYQEFFNKMQEYDVDYDIIGASYYPYWHGSIDELMRNFDECKRFGKEIMIMELGYGFTLKGYNVEGKEARLVIDSERIGNDALVKKYPINEQGQAKFIKDVLDNSKAHGVSAVFYWEPLWIPGDGICWASVEGQEYIGESGKSTTNEWANQCLYDYSGNALKALDVFKL